MGLVSSHETLTKSGLVSDIAKTFDVLGWFSPVIVTMKILLQCVWESKVNWNDLVPANVQSRPGACGGLINIRNYVCKNETAGT